MSHHVSDPVSRLPFGRLVPRSDLAGMAWPAIPPVRGMALLALLYQLERSQWWSPDQLRVQQFRQLGHLFRHAKATTASTATANSPDSQYSSLVTADLLSAGGAVSGFPPQRGQCDWSA